MILIRPVPFFGIGLDEIRLFHDSPTVDTSFLSAVTNLGVRSMRWPGGNVNGLFWNAGFGYKISVSKSNDAILLYFGYSNKVYSEEIKTTYPCLVGPCPENIETYKYNLQALSIKVGYGF